jgi:cytoskeletal protein CcmA (bactofilin family)
MKNSFLMASIVMITMALSLGNGLVIKRDQSVEIPDTMVIDDDLLAFAGDIDIKGTVTGNVYAFGQSVTVSGVIGGSLYSGGATISINPKSVQSVGAAGGNVKVSGAIAKNLILFGGSLMVDKQTSIGKDLRAYGGKLIMDGVIAGAIKGAVGDFIMSGKSGRIKIKSDKTNIKSSAYVAGDLCLTSENKPVIEEGATITGEITIQEARAEETGSFLAALAPMLAFIFMMIKIVMLIAKIIVGVLLIALFRRYMRRIMDTLNTETWKSLGWGFLTVIVVPVAVVILFAILVGSPIAILGIYLYTVVVYLSSIIVALVLGEKIIGLFKKEGAISMYLSFIIGILILFVVGFIPVLNALVCIFTLLFGFGATVLASWHLLKEMREKELV